MRLLHIAAVTSLFAQSAWTVPANSEPLADLKPVRSVAISFTPGIPVLTPQSHAHLKAATSLVPSAGCYWLAEAHNQNEAEALRAALAEYNIAVEAVALAIDRTLPGAEARLYCTPPDPIFVIFAPQRASLGEEAEAMLNLAVAAYWTSNGSLTVKGFAAAQESDDPLKLALDRAIAARDYLIAAGLAAKRLSLEANTQALGRDAQRVAIMPKP